ncbi:MAG: glycosyltransferase family 1 protein [Sedimentisphaerales bacterium]|nr:glycosyltransferase family 1 protein [Sedimentisphaerales bacterium]
MNRKIKVLIIQRVCPDYRIPVFQKLSEIFDLTVFCSKGTSSGGNRNGPIHEVTWSRTLPSWGRYFEIGTHGYYLPIFPTMISEISKSPFDVIITEGATNIVNNLVLFSHRNRIKTPIIWWDAGRHENAPLKWPRRMMEPVLRQMIRNAQGCLAYGSQARDYFEKMGVSPQRIFLAQNTVSGLDLSQGPVSADQIRELKTSLGLQDKKILLYAGALEKRKKIDFLLKVMQVLPRKDTFLIILGDGCDETRLRKLVQKMELQDQVWFAGRKYEDRASYFHMADVYVIPSKFGFVNLPMMYAKPVVVNRFIAESELVKHGVNGFKCDDEDLYDYVTSINSILDDEQLALRLGANSKRLITQQADLKQMIRGIVLAVYTVLHQNDTMQQENRPWIHSVN